MSDAADAAPTKDQDMTEAFNPFAGVNTASTTTNGSYLEPGRYLLRIGKCIYKNLFKGGDAFIVETTVIESSNPNIPVGGSRTWLQKKNESFKGAVKLFAIAAAGYDVKDEKQEKTIKENVEPHTEVLLMNAITKNVLNGREIYVDVTPKDKKQSEGTFNLHTFSPAMPPMGG